MMSVLLVLWLAAFVCTIASALNKAPLWLAVLIICVIGLLSVLPLK